MSRTLAVVTGVGNVGFAATFLATIGRHTGTRIPLYYIEDRRSGCDFAPFESVFSGEYLFTEILQHTGRGGCNALWNQAVQLAYHKQCDNCLVFNDDVLAGKPDLLHQMVAVLDQNDHVAMVGTGSDGAWDGAHRVRERWFTDPSLLVESAAHCETFRKQPVKYVHHVSGLAWGCKTKLWLEAGGIDERFFWAFGEVQPCIELRKRGYQSVAVQYPVTVMHWGGGAFYDIHSDEERHRSFEKRAGQYGDEGKLFAEMYGTGHVHLLAQEFDSKLPSMGLPEIRYSHE